MNTSPCENCQIRKIGCHPRCETFGAWKDEQQRIKDNRYEYIKSLGNPNATKRRIAWMRRKRKC